jgi:hypothetical protein
LSDEMKLHALQFAGGDLEKAKAMYAWLTEGEAAPKPKAERKPKEAAPETPKEAKPENMTATEAAKPQPPADTVVGALDYQKDVVSVVAATAAKVGKPAVLALFESKFGASHAKEIPAEKWAELIAALKALANG